jgi:hypothetical protein
MAVPRWLDPFAELGAAAGTVYIVDRALKRISPTLGVHLHDLIEQPVAGPPLLSPAHAQHVRYKILCPNSAELDEMPRPEHVIRMRFESGAVALAVYLRGKYVGYIWLAFDHYDEDEVRCRIALEHPERSAFDFDVYVFPAFRLGRAFAAVWHAANEYLRSRGIERTCSRIATANVSSRRAHAQLGAHRLGRALYVCLGQLQLTFSPAMRAPWVHASATTAPTLTL